MPQRTDRMNHTGNFLRRQRVILQIISQSILIYNSSLRQNAIQSRRPRSLSKNKNILSKDVINFFNNINARQSRTNVASPRLVRFLKYQFSKIVHSLDIPILTNKKYNVKSFS